MVCLLAHARLATRMPRLGLLGSFDPTLIRLVRTPAGVTDDLPRAFRTADLWLIHAAICCSRYSSWTCCGVRY